MVSRIAVLAMLLIAAPVFAEEKPRLDRHGDPLPAGAVARLGTVRWRHPDGPMHLAFSHDGKTLASSGWEQVRFWEVSSGRQIKRLPEKPNANDFHTYAPIAFNVRGGVLVLDDRDNDEIVLYEPETRRKLRQITGWSTAALSADGNVAATLDRKGDGSTIWDTRTGKKVCELHDLWVDALSADGKLFAATDPPSAERDSGRVFVGETATGKLLQKIDVGKGVWLRLGAFTPDGKNIAALKWDPDGQSEIVICGLDGDKLRSLKRNSVLGLPLAFSPDGKLLAIITGQAIVLLDAAKGTEVSNSAVGHQAIITALAFRKGAGQVVTACESGSIRTWDVATSVVQREFTLPNLAPRSVSVSQDGTTIGWTDQKHVRVWDAAAANERKRFELGQELNGFINEGPGPIRVSPDAKFVMAWTSPQIIGLATPRTRLKVWEADTGKELTRNPIKGASAATLTPDGRCVVITFDDGKHRLLDLRTEKCIREYSAPPEYNYPHIRIVSPDGKLLVAITPDQAILVWNIENTKCIWTTRNRKFWPSPGLSLMAESPFAFSPDSKQAAGFRWRKPHCVLVARRHRQGNSPAQRTHRRRHRARLFIGWQTPGLGQRGHDGPDLGHVAEMTSRPITAPGFHPGLPTSAAPRLKTISNPTPVGRSFL